jgi:hypothetical protein
MIATTISNSMSENPLVERICVPFEGSAIGRN